MDSAKQSVIDSTQYVLKPPSIWIKNKICYRDTVVQDDEDYDDEEQEEQHYGVPGTWRLSLDEIIMCFSTKQDCY